MKSRKNFAKTISIATTLITLTFFAFGCGDAKTTADTPEETEKATEIVSQEETEKPETEVVAEEETETTEQETETENEEPVLFRIVVSNPNGDQVGLFDRSSYLEADPVMEVPNGTEFNVGKVCQNDGENKTFYRVKMEDGNYRYILEDYAQVIE